MIHPVRGDKTSLHTVNVEQLFKDIYLKGCKIISLARTPTGPCPALVINWGHVVLCSLLSLRPNIHLSTLFSGFDDDKMSNLNTRSAHTIINHAVYNWYYAFAYRIWRNKEWGNELPTALRMPSFWTVVGQSITWKAHACLYTSEARRCVNTGAKSMSVVV
jgi:hypothetical protein